MAGKRIGRPVSFKQRPWSRCLNMVKTGKGDAMMNIFKTPDRERFMIYASTSLAREVNRFFILKGRNITFDGDLSHLAGKRIRALARYIEGGSRLRAIGPGITDDPLYIGFSKALAERFSKALAAGKGL